MTLDPQNLQQLSALLEVLQNPNHWAHAKAIEMADEVHDAAHQERVENGQKMMQDQIDNMGADDWAAWKALTD